MPSVPRKYPIWLYPNLLSLDAPLVAVAWLHILVVSWRLYVPWQAYAALGLGVWVIYATDRLLDAGITSKTCKNLDPRHHFHRRFRHFFVVAIIAASIAAIKLVIQTMPMPFYSHLLLGVILVGAFFGLSLASNRSETENTLIKNAIAGFTFAFGTAMTAHVFRPAMSLADLLQAREFLLFALLCILNISAIDIWEHSSRSGDDEVKVSNEISLTFPIALLASAAIFFALRSEHERNFHYAILTAAGLMHILNRQRKNLSTDALRALADLVLLVPWVYFSLADPYG